jgi:hypothetical protein
LKLYSRFGSANIGMFLFFQIIYPSFIN